jgi:tRNA(fMet)-specific endonuclease VapC
VAYVLDTNIISAVQRRNRTVLARIQALPQSDVFVTMISLQEQIAGRFNTINRQTKPDGLVVAFSDLTETFDFYAAAYILPYDNAAARIDDDLRVRLRRMGTFDRRIAAITLAHGHTLVTRNTIDFRDVPGLGLEDWMAS